ncbi:hypothetical protein [Shumkonia mesophila]|uniref:hypothetical protein n=1 Tax=Shumkonia mesophila TaxID=2838854 RepID=UPI002934199C|nr:hypothetical protein [Shumkonia mesophila]
MSIARQKWAYFFAFLFVGLSLGPSLAHLLALPNKIDLPEAAYFTAQAIYRGWALLGVVVVGALASTLTLTILVWRQPAAARWAGLAFLGLAGAQALFWIYTFPANRATANWTTVPPGWEALRTQWEYSHAAGAGLNLLALVALVLSVLAWGSAERDGRRS